MQTTVKSPLGVRVISKRKRTRGIMTPRLRSCNGMMPSPDRLQLRTVKIYSEMSYLARSHKRGKNACPDIMSDNAPVVLNLLTSHAPFAELEQAFQEF